jgi:hypothetical protein
MCGIIRKPTRRTSFPVPQSAFKHLSKETFTAVILVCEETHIPEIATKAVLLFADYAAGMKDFTFLSVPFALYEGGKRYISKETMLIEGAVMHLAMAGSARHHINEALIPYGIRLELGHCCDIQMHEIAHAKEAMILSHDGNVYRADRLRELGDNDEVTVSSEEFIEKLPQSQVCHIAKLIFLSKEELVV